MEQKKVDTEFLGHAGMIGFIGAGNMAEAMIAALIQTGVFPPENIRFSEMHPERSSYIAETYGAVHVSDNAGIIRDCSIVVLAVKPQQMIGVLKDLAACNAFDGIAGRLLVISIAAGLKIATFEKFIYAGKTEDQRQRMPVIRVMPNTPALVGAGMCAFSANDRATEADIETTRRILEAMGKAIRCDETKMDAVTAISGSGPAYCYYFIESIVDAGTQLGLAPEEACRLIVSTFDGALRLIEEKGGSPADLRRNVTSPGGTTEAAIRVFETRKLKEILIAAIISAAQRSEELSRDV
jgi:pyrroline-5-carboxylate reductase